MNYPLLFVLGGFIGLDATSGPQLMFSRPIVAATLTAWAFGRPAEGLILGALLEAFSLVVLPVGAARYPESGTAAAAAAAAYTSVAAPGLEPPVLLLAAAFGLVWERVTGRTVTMVRRANERLIRWRPSPASVPAREVERRHVAAMGVDFLRGGLATVVGALVGAAVIGAAAPHWGPNAGFTVGILVVAGTAMVAAALPLFGGWRERRLAFSLGVICGLLMSLLR